MKYLLLLVLAACVMTRVTPLGNRATHQAIPAQQVVVYRSADQIKSGYDEIALLTLDDDPNANFLVMSAMKKKAGALGANAVLLVSRDKQVGDSPQAVAIYVRAQP